MGEIKLERGYYYCEKCRLGEFPLDKAMEVKEKNVTEGLLKEMVWLSGEIAGYEKGEEVLARIGQVYVSDSTIWRQAQKWGAVFKEVEEERKEKAMALPKRGASIAAQSERRNERLGGAMDGAMVHIRQEGWKELKVGAIFEIKETQLVVAESEEKMEVGQAANSSYVAHLGGAEQFGQLMWAEAKARGWEEVFDTQILGDGAPWIWNQTELHFFYSRQTLDWNHALSHLHQAAHLLYPDNPPAAQRWVNRTETDLFQGHADRIASELIQGGLGAAAPYFEDNKRRMQYMELREDGFLIGSGVVESAAKQFKARFSGPGMRWSRPGLEHLLPIRSAVMSGSFDSLWDNAYHSPLN